MALHGRNRVYLPGRSGTMWDTTDKASLEMGSSPIMRLGNGSMNFCFWGDCKMERIAVAAWTISPGLSISNLGLCCTTGVNS